MRLHPILAALKQHKASALLIALQMALTLAIVCNAMFIINQRIERINRPTGLKEQNLFLVSQQWVNAPTGTDAASIQKLDAMQQTDIETLRRLPDVESASSILSLPLLNSGWAGGVALHPEQRQPTAHASFYFGSTQMISTLGVRLISGRGFSANDYTNRSFQDSREPAVTIITKALADRLFHGGNAVGQTIYLDSSSQPTTVIGVIDRLQIPSSESWAKGFTWYSLLIPMRLNADWTRYAVRAKPGRLEAAMKEARSALYAANPMRVIDDSNGADNGVRPFSAIRAYAYRADRGLAGVMAVICIVLLALTAAGIVGLTSFWVGQRQKQIGVRRALGARKIDIMRYFQLENLMVVGVGVIIGIVLAIGLNIWLMRILEMERISASFIIYGVFVVFALGQAAAFVPARRASKVSPVQAIRS